MSFSKPKSPKEPADAKALRARQVADMAKLDDEENRRIKAMLRARAGGRAFRTPSAPRTAANTRGSLATATGFVAPAMTATRSAASPFRNMGGAFGGAQP